MHRWGKLAHGGMMLDIGAENYPFPFALLKDSSGQWYFDTNLAKHRDTGSPGRWEWIVDRGNSKRHGRRTG